MKQGWKIKKLGEVCEIQYGTRVVQKKDKGSLYYVYGGGGATFMVDFYNREDCFIVSRFAMSPKCTRFVKGKFFLNDSGLSVHPKNNSLTQAFVDKSLLASNDRIYSLGKGAAQKNLDIASFKMIPIPIPPLAEQERIVTELDLLSLIIEKKKAQLTALDTLCQSIFYEMFGDPIINEKGWEIKKLGEVCKTMSGGTPKSDVKDYYNGNIPWLRSGEINTLFITGTELTISELGLQKSSAKWIPINSVAIAMYGATVGQVGIIKQRMTTNQAICSILPNEVVNSIFLCFYLHSLKPQFIKDAIGGAQANISQDLIRKTTIILPPLQLQQTFADKITAIEQQKSIIRQSLTETQTLFNSRMSHYFD